jgi:hypothetical protein
LRGRHISRAGRQRKNATLEAGRYLDASPPRLILEIDIRKLLPAGVLYNEGCANSSTDQGGGIISIFELTRITQSTYFWRCSYFSKPPSTVTRQSQTQSWLTGWSMSTLPPGFIQTRFLAQKPRTRSLTSLVCFWILWDEIIRHPTKEKARNYQRLDASSPL